MRADSQRLLSRPLAIVAVASIAVLAATGCVDPPLFPEPLGPDAMRADLVATGFAGVAAPGTVISGAVRVRNEGRGIFPADGETSPGFKVNLGYRWLDARGNVAIPNGDGRVALPGRLRPGASVTLDVEVRSPLGIGDYLLEFDLVQEGVAWFADKGSRTCRVPVRVTTRS